MPTEKFFSRQNIHVQIWTAIGGIVGAAFTYLISTLSGSSKVVVDTEATRSQPISVNVVDGQGITKHDLEQLTSAISALNATASKQDPNVQLKAVRSDLSKLQARLDKQSVGKASSKQTPPTGLPVQLPQASKPPATQSGSVDVKAAIERHNAASEPQLSSSDDVLAQIKKRALESQAQTEKLRQRLAAIADQDEFRLPSTVKGYTSESLGGVKNA